MIDRRGFLAVCSAGLGLVDSYLRTPEAPPPRQLVTLELPSSAIELTPAPFLQLDIRWRARPLNPVSIMGLTSRVNRHPALGFLPGTLCVYRTEGRRDLHDMWWVHLVCAVAESFPGHPAVDFDDVIPLDAEYWLRWTIGGQGLIEAETECPPWK